MSAKLKQQVTDLLLNNSDILKLIAEAVSLLIVDKFTNNKETVGQIAEKISNKPDFIKAIKLNTSDQESLKQELHESLSFDYKNLQDKQQELEKICREMRETNQDLVWGLDSLEQYGRRNCLLFHGVPEPPHGSRSENTNTAVIAIMNNKLGIRVNESDLDRSHRIGRQKRSAAKPGPIIVKFISYKTRAEVFRNKRSLKQTRLGITESLTRKRAELYSNVSDHPNVETAWTIDGRVVALRYDTKTKVYIESPKDLCKLTDPN